MRCLDDLPKGCFICVYTGLLLSEDEANEDGAQAGDEYLAELDHIEVVERHKEEQKPDDEGIGEDSDFEDEEINSKVNVKFE
jgi:histone-lysine N-methyltransferase SETDB1